MLAKHCPTHPSNSSHKAVGGPVSVGIQMYTQLMQWPIHQGQEKGPSISIYYYIAAKINFRMKKLWALGSKRFGALCICVR